MVKNEEYVNLLKSIVSCVSHGDYYSAKEISNLKLEKMKEEERIIQKEINKIKRKTQMRLSKNKPLKDWNNKELVILIESYSKYVLNKIEKTKNIQELQYQAISIEEFIKKI